MLTVTHDDHRLAIHRAGLPRPLVTQHAPPGKRPFLHPIAAPDGVGTLTENEPPHHPWQHGLYVGLNAVNGYGFWTEGCRNAPTDGTFHPRPLAPPEADADGDTVHWHVDTEYRAPDGAPLMAETQRWSLHDDHATSRLDIDWSLQALTDVNFGQYAYGGLFLRMPWRKETHGHLLTSAGATAHGAAEGRPAAWVALSMPIPDRDGRPAGFAFFDHPANPVHPTPWRVDDNLGVGPSRSIAGAWSLAEGQATRSRYRLVAFTGAIDASFVRRQWADYAVLA